LPASYYFEANPVFERPMEVSESNAEVDDLMAIQPAKHWSSRIAPVLKTMLLGSFFILVGVALGCLLVSLCFDNLVALP
jgi:capsular polysaccharide biosynthesis protein